MPSAAPALWRRQSPGNPLLSSAGLIVGGVVAAPLAALISRVLPVRPFAWLIGLLILVLAGIQLVGPLLGR